MDMAKTHLKITGVEYRGAGKSDFEYNHQNACGYVRDIVTRNMEAVDCKICLREVDKADGIDNLSNYGGGH